MNALEKAGTDMLDKIKEISLTCHQVALESIERKSELLGYEKKLANAKNAIANLPTCSDEIQDKVLKNYICLVKNV